MAWSKEEKEKRRRKCKHEDVEQQSGDFPGVYRCRQCGARLVRTRFPEPDGMKEIEDVH